MTIRTRLERLESAPENRPPVLIWQHHDETAESAMTRWSAANPSRPSPDKAGSRVYLISWAAPSSEGVAA